MSVKFAVKSEDAFTGVLYDGINDDIKTHHDQYGEVLVKVRGLVNTGTEEEPVWEETQEDTSYSPMRVTMRQARLQLHKDGMLTDAEQAINDLPEPDRTEALIEWEYATSVERHSPLVASLGQALSLDDDQLNALFRNAEFL